MGGYHHCVVGRSSLRLGARIAGIGDGLKGDNQKMKRLGLIILPLLLFAMTAAMVFADDDDQEDKGKKAPEVPYALIYPAVAVAGYGLFRVVQARSHKP